ncbi:hypothetical protein Angca_001278 [Angiostrongylus cantonensis]|nr:hypothetical protein Angca_001278 [Angiostrongylus cantonensis]
MWLSAALLLISVVHGQVVNVTIFTESQCPYCTRLLREQIWPFYVTRPGIMNLQLILLRSRVVTDYQQNIDRNRLIINDEIVTNDMTTCSYFQYFPRRHFGLLTCVQGLATLREAFSRCLSRLSVRTQRRLIECATTQTGELLSYYSMVNTHRTGVRVWPTVYVNGVYFDRSYPMETKICQETYWC